MFMADLFAFPFDFIDKVIEVAEVTPWHTYQILTKRPERMLEYFKWRWNNADQHTLDCTKAKQWKKEHNVKMDNMFVPNLWLGVTAEDQDMWDKRKEAFFNTPAAIHFVSNEPLLRAIKYSDEDLKRLDWCIIGCESGPGRRFCDHHWANNLVKQCKAAGVACFVKQLQENDSGKNKIVSLPPGWPREFPKKPKRITTSKKN